MAAEHELTPTGYIGHHLRNFSVSVGEGEGGFWALNVDTLVMSVVLGVLGMGFIWWVVRGATAGVPNKRQAFVELATEFVDDQVQSIFHGDRHRFLAPATLTVGVWVLLMNAMDLVPIDWFTTLFMEGLLGVPAWKPVPTTDVNTTFALALSVWLLAIFFSLKVKGFGGYMHELFGHPFGLSPVWAAPALMAFNLLFNLIEMVSRPLSHSLRLFGNMYAGELIFLLLGLWAATGLAGTFFGAVLGVGWAIFETLIIFLQAYIFMVLTVVYLAMAHEHH